MDNPQLIIWNIFIVLFLVFLNGFFVAAEFAMVKVRNTRIDTLLQEGNKKATHAKEVIQKLDAYLSACQLGITLASLALGWVGEPAVSQMIKPLFLKLGFSHLAIESISFIIAFSVITILHIVLGELAPKAVAIRKSDAVTLWAALPLILFHKIMYPFIWMLNGLANVLLKFIGIEPTSEHESAHSEEEIRILVKESHKSGLINKTELTLVDNIFDFTERHAREIMIPRTEMVCLFSQHTFEENKQVAIQEMHTRYPVCEMDKDNVIGFINVKDILSNPNLSHMNDIIREIIRVPESIPISSLLKQMQKNKTQMALVIDEYGGTAGLVTLEDIIEEIVGEIQDEFDEERQPIERKGDKSYSVDGKMLIEDLNHHFGLSIDSSDYDTIGGWMYAKIEIPPVKNQKVSFEDYDFIVEEVQNMRISRIEIRKK